MFTGIVAATGILDRIQSVGGDVRLQVRCEAIDFGGVQLGDSIAVSGVCLTAVELHPHGFAADVSRETLAVTTAQQWRAGDQVNLELALQPQSRLGGHIVSGHVDGIGELLRRYADGRSERLDFRVPKALAKYIAHKGSVCIDGVSLTVNAVNGSEFGVNIIPHTAERTTLHAFKPGRKVNIEVDVIARYLERLLSGNVEEGARSEAAGKRSPAEAGAQDAGEGGHGSSTNSGISLERLARTGFIK
ncbi:MAG TPA: riboflavin synthase [Candidatus Acidoferrum sp.]|nr:riboflavin synthase [Candidatus Acidoferrum sp.]